MRPHEVSHGLYLLNGGQIGSRRDSLEGESEGWDGEGESGEHATVAAMADIFRARLAHITRGKKSLIAEENAEDYTQQANSLPKSLVTKKIKTRSELLPQPECLINLIYGCLIPLATVNIFFFCQISESLL